MNIIQNQVKIKRGFFFPSFHWQFCDINFEYIFFHACTHTPPLTLVLNSDECTQCVIQLTASPSSSCRFLLITPFPVSSLPFTHLSTCKFQLERQVWPESCEYVSTVRKRKGGTRLHFCLALLEDVPITEPSECVSVCVCDWKRKCQKKEDIYVTETERRRKSVSEVSTSVTNDRPLWTLVLNIYTTHTHMTCQVFTHLQRCRAPGRYRLDWRYDQNSFLCLCETASWTRWTGCWSLGTAHMHSDICKSALVPIQMFSSVRRLIRTLLKK